MLNRVLPLALVGSAACWWWLQVPFETWEVFQERFRTEFLPPGYESRILRELELRTQHPNESLLEFVRALQELYRRASPQSSQGEMVARVLRQCHPRFYPYLHGRTYATMDDVAHDARSIQERLLAELHYAPPPPPTQALEPTCAWTGPGAHQLPPAEPVDRAVDPHLFVRNAGMQPHPGSHNSFTVTNSVRPWRGQRNALRPWRGQAALRPWRGQAGVRPWRGQPGVRPWRGQPEEDAFRQETTNPMFHASENVGCYQCGQPGHYQRSCPLLPRMSQGNGNRRRR